MEEVIKTLQERLRASESMWESKESHPFIIGFLQASIKTAIQDLENLETIKNK